ncbi:MAG: hypothetical protein AB7L66_12135, partial [Gemmatimonadales bacterium]
RAAAQSSLSGYRTGSVDFESVVVGQLAALRAELELVDRRAELARVVAELEFLGAVEAPTGESR